MRPLFGPTAKVTDPAGAEWELYVSRFRGPRWETRDYDTPTDLLMWNGNPSGGVLLLLEIPLFVVNCILVPAVTFVLRLPVAVVHSRRSQTWTVEAVCWWPHEQRFRWSVQAGDRARVAAEIGHRDCGRALGATRGRGLPPPGRPLSPGSV